MESAYKLPQNNLLRKARLERGLTQEALAERVGAMPVSVNRWENGATFPSPSFRKALQEALGKSVAELGLLPQAFKEEKIFTMPNKQNPLFTGRDAVLQLLHKRLATTRMATLTTAQALYGLGGIGKTQTATEYVYRFGEEYSHILWMRAASRELLITDFVALARLLGLVGRKKQDSESSISAVKQWLSGHSNWLLILDDADDLLLVQEFLPANHNGRVLLTTHTPATGGIADGIEIEKLDVQESVLLLLRQSKQLLMDAPLESVKPTDHTLAGRIVEELDGLPLAIAQAGAYIEETGCSLSDYLSLYATHRKEVLSRKSRLVLNYSETVYTTWLLSFREIDSRSPASARILRLCAFLAPDAIPEELFMSGAGALDEATRVRITDAFKRNETLEVLRGYSLVHRNGETHMLNVHRLVQTVLKDVMNEETQHAYAEQTIRLVHAAFPKDNYDGGIDQQYYLQYYVPHVQECATLIKHYRLHFPEAIELLYLAGTFLHTCGLYTLSQSLHLQALAIRREVLDSDEYLEVADSLNYLAVLARVQGHDEEAERLHRQVLAIREKLFGRDSLQVAQSLNNLAVLYRNQGKYKDAEPLLQRALTLRKQLLSPEDSQTLLTSMNLAHLYLERGEYQLAEQMLMQTLTVSKAAPDPSATLVAHNLQLLARVSFAQGKYEEAESLWKRALETLDNIYGSEHPALAESLDGLASLAFARKDPLQARSLCQRALTINEDTFGPNHPDTIRYRKHLSKMK